MHLIGALCNLKVTLRARRRFPIYGSPDGSHRERRPHRRPGPARVGADHQRRAPRPLVRQRRRRGRAAPGRRAVAAAGASTAPSTAASRPSSRRTASPTAGRRRRTRRQEPTPANSTLIEFTLARRGRRHARSRVVETGFDGLASSGRAGRRVRLSTPRAGRASSRAAPTTRSGRRRAMSAAVADPEPAVFAALADPTRWRVLGMLAQRGEGTATTLAGELPVSRPAVIKHLGVLDRAGLVSAPAGGPRGALPRRARAARTRPRGGSPTSPSHWDTGWPPSRRLQSRWPSERRRPSPDAGKSLERSTGHATDRVAAGVGGRARGTAGQGEGAHPRPRCAGRRAPPDAADGRREGLPLRGARTAR